MKWSIFILIIYSHLCSAWELQYKVHCDAWSISNRNLAMCIPDEYIVREIGDGYIDFSTENYDSALSIYRDDKQIKFSGPLFIYDSEKIINGFKVTYYLAKDEEYKTPLGYFSIINLPDETGPYVVISGENIEFINQKIISILKSKKYKKF